MSRVEAAGAVNTLVKGMVTDANLIEYPANTARWLQNVVLRDDGITERRPGYKPTENDYVGVSGSAGPFHSNDLNSAYDWFPDNNNLTPVVIHSGGVFINRVNLVPDMERMFYAGYTNGTLATGYFKNPGTGEVPSTSQEYFTNLSAFYAANGGCETQTNTGDPISAGSMTATFECKFLLSGTTYYRRVVFTRTLGDATGDYGKLVGAPTEHLQIDSYKNLLLVSGVGILPFIIWMKQKPKLVSGTVITDTRYFIEPIDMTYREFEDIPDGVALTDQVNSTPTNANLEYNLFNRGWTTATLSTYTAATGKYPKKTQVWWTGKDSTGVLVPSKLDANYFGSGSAAVGSTILASDMLMVPPTSTCTGLGRCWYTGSMSPKFRNAVFYSQTITAFDYPAESVARCYSVNDPTAEFYNGTLGTDGGYVRFADALNIIAVKAFSDGILVFAKNGVWYLTGNAFGQFLGNSFQYYKITDVGCLGASGIVHAKENMYYLGTNGVMLLTRDPQNRSVLAKNISVGKISQWYKDNVAGHYVKGHYDYVSESIYWHYDIAHANAFGQANISFAPNNPAFYNWVSSNFTALVYKVPFDAFHYWQIDRPYYGATNFTGAMFFEAADAINDQHLYKGFVRHTVTGESDAGMDDYADWFSFYAGYTPQMYVSTMTVSTNNSVNQFRKQITAVHSLFKNSAHTLFTGDSRVIVDGSCFVQVRFNNANSSVSGRYSPQQQAYRNVIGWLADPDNPVPYDVIRTRTKVRGKGDFSECVFTSEANKDFKFIGYSLEYTEPSNVAQRGQA